MTFKEEAKSVLKSLTRKTYRHRDTYTPARKFTEEQHIEEALASLVRLVDGLIGPDHNEMPSWGSGELAGDSKHTKRTQIENRLRHEMRTRLEK